MIELVIKGAWLDLKYKMPESWEELTGEQFSDIAAVLFGTEGQKLQTEMRLLKILTGWKRWKMKYVGTDNVADLLPLTDWVLNDAVITKQLLPVLKVKGGKYYGPYDCLQNLTNNEFDAAERCLSLWHNLTPALSTSGEGDVERAGDVWENEEARGLLYEFVAVLYRPAKKKYDRKKDAEGDVREVYNQNLVAKRAAMFRKHMPVKYVQAILIWYKGCRTYMYEQFQDIFNQESTGAPQSSDAYFGMMRAIAKEGIYGDFDKVEQMYIYTMLVELRKAKEDYERWKSLNEAGGRAPAV